MFLPTFKLIKKWTSKQPLWMSYYQLLKPLVMFPSSPPLYIGRSFTSIWLFTTFEEQLRKVIQLAILVTLPWLEKFQALPGISCYPFHHSFLKSRVLFKHFSADSINMKSLLSYWPLQLVKGTGSAIPPLNFNLFGTEGLLHKKIERLFYSAR